jgi:hypothetical protein
MTIELKNLIGAAKKARDFLNILTSNPFDREDEQREILKELDQRIRQMEAATEAAAE